MRTRKRNLYCQHSQQFLLTMQNISLSESINTNSVEQSYTTEWPETNDERCFHSNTDINILGHSRVRLTKYVRFLLRVLEGLLNNVSDNLAK